MPRSTPTAAFLACALVVGGVSPIFAHDPYEITSTLSLYGNRTELQIDLEFHAGMLLAGNAGTNVSGDASNSFEVARSALTRTAAQFFRLSIGSEDVKPASTAVSLGVENHIRFKLAYPPLSANQFSLEAPGLKSLSDQGPYGASLTVLDMENRKVLGQSVLFASSPPVALRRYPAKSLNAHAAASQEPVRVSRSDLSSPAAAARLPAEPLKPWKAFLIAILGLAVGAMLAFARGRCNRKERPI